MGVKDTTINNLKETLSRLFHFTNEHHHIVKDSALLQTEEQLCAYELVGRFLWRSDGLVDAYIDANPDQLSDDQLADICQLKNVLYDDFLLWRSDDAGTILLHPSGVYRAIFPEDYLCFREHELPLSIRGAIASYQGVIVGAMPFTVLGHAPSSHFSALVDKNAEHSTLNLVEDGPTFSRQLDQWRRQRRQVHQENGTPQDGIPEGFRRSVLAGTAGEERKQIRKKYLDKQLIGSEYYFASLEAKSVKAHYFPFSLKEGLELLDDDWLLDIYEDVGSKPCSRNFSREDLIDAICHDLLANEEERDTALLWCEDDQYKLVAALMKTNPLSLMTLSPSSVIELYPMIPYVFILQDKDAFVAWMPPEVRTLISKANLSRIAEIRTQLREAARAADALATMCGIISVDDAYERYRRAVTDPLDRKEFSLALIELEDCMVRDAYSLWEHEGVDYLVCVELSDASAPARVIRESYTSRILDEEANEPLHGDDSPSPNSLIDDEQAFVDKLFAAEEQLQQARISLLETQSMTPCEIPPQMLTCRPVEAIMETPRFCDLRAFIDERVPEGEDDLTFADVFARSVIVSSLLMNESYGDTLDTIRLFGMQHCEGTEFSDTMGRLVTNAFNALPRWGLSGWSLEENTHRITGRKRQYRPDGSIIEIADDTWQSCEGGNTFPETESRKAS